MPIQKLNFTANLGQDGNTAIFFITEEANETISDFFTRTCESNVNVVHNLFSFNIISIQNDSI